MATGDKYLAIAVNRLLGKESFKNYLFDYLQSDMGNILSQAYRTAGTFEEIDITSDGADKIQLQNWSTTEISALDGTGKFIDLRERPTDVQDIQFENALATDYQVAIRMASLPGGMFINPVDGLPVWDYYEEIVGVVGTPDSVVDNGDGTMSFVVNDVTQSGVDNTGREVVVYKNTIDKNALLESTAKETCTVFYSGGNNQITTVGDFGQDSPSTTASDYTIILIGPRIGDGLGLDTNADYCYIGIVTGAGAGNPPTSFSTAGQKVIDIPLSDLTDIVRYENASGTDRLKIDVAVYSGDESTDQIRVTDSGAGTPIRFRVDGQGNVEIQGDLTVQGDTYQKDITQVNTHQAYFDNLDIGNADTDSHIFKGALDYQSVGLSKSIFTIDPTTPKFAINGAAGTGVFIVHGDTECDGNLITSTGDTNSIGETGTRWGTIYVNQIKSTDVEVAGDISPASDNNGSLGDSSIPLRWNLVDVAGEVQVTLAADQTINLFRAAQTNTYFETDAAPIRLANHDAGTNEKNWVLSTKDDGGVEKLKFGSALDNWGAGIDFLAVTRTADSTAISSMILKADVVQSEGPFEPQAHNTYALGGSSNRWSTIYGTTLNGDVEAPSYVQAGDSNFKMSLSTNSYINWDTNNDFMVYVRGSDEWQWKINNVIIAKIGADSDGSNPYADFSGDINVTGDVQGDTLTLTTTAGKGVTTDLVPDSNDDQDLGNASYGWRHAYARTVQLEGGTSTEPHVELLHTAASADNQKWHIKAFSTGNLQFMAVNDAESAASNAMYFTRTDEQVDKAVFPIADVEIDHTEPKFTLYENDASANRKRIQLIHTGDVFKIGNINDSSTFQPYLTFTKETAGTPDVMLYDGGSFAIKTTASYSGTSGYLTYTGYSVIPSLTNSKPVVGDTAENNSGFIGIYIGATIKYIPYFDNY